MMCVFTCHNESNFLPLFLTFNKCNRCFLSVHLLKIMLPVYSLRSLGNRFFTMDYLLGRCVLFFLGKRTRNGPSGRLLSQSHDTWHHNGKKSHTRLPQLSFVFYVLSQLTSVEINANPVKTCFVRILHVNRGTCFDFSLFKLCECACVQYVCRCV